jgi:DNA-binding MarR family transcriptional regulator
MTIPAADREMMRDLARFRYNLRRFLRFSEKAARACGVTPQQHQLMLGVAGFTERGTATISELAEFLQERNNSVVGLVERAAESGLVTRQPGALDRRRVIVSLTARGERILAKLSRLHHDEVQRVRAGFGSPARPKGKAAP